MAVDKTHCPECGGRMADGRIVDYRRDSAHPTEWVEGELETSFWTGRVKNEARFKIAAHRCEKCGYLKFYADTPATSPGNVYR